MLFKVWIRNLFFKEAKADERMFIKFGKDVGKLQLNGELTYVISVYGFFKKGSPGTAFLQMDLIKVKTEKISILGKRAVEKNFADEPPVKQPRNYTPNSTVVKFNDDLW